MNRTRTLIAATAIAATATIAPTGHTDAVGGCSIWLSTASNPDSGSARCTYFNPGDRAQLRLTCRNWAGYRTTARSNTVAASNYLMTAFCPSTHPFVISGTVYGWNIS